MEESAAQVTSIPSSTETSALFSFKKSFGTRQVISIFSSIMTGLLELAVLWEIDFELGNLGIAHVSCISSSVTLSLLLFVIVWPVSLTALFEAPLLVEVKLELINFGIAQVNSILASSS